MDTSYLIVPYPSGSNASETFIEGRPFNLTTLQFWNYTLYTNNTVSNTSHCYLAFDPYTPAYIFPNGSWTNATTCYTNVFGIRNRGLAGLGFGAIFAISLILSLFNLSTLGLQLLPTEKRFAPVSRRWQWYYAVLASIFAVISLFTNIDVDRFYVQQLPIILNVFFWYLMQMAVLALVWESVRHWSSWEERQIVDPDSRALRQDDRRSTVEFYLPLIFYVFFMLNFFMIVPRSWTKVQWQRYPGQAQQFAAKTATDNRFKAAGFLSVMAWLVILTSLVHSVEHYRNRHPEPIIRSRPLWRKVPFHFMITVPLSLAMLAYQIICAFNFDVSPFKVGTNLVAMYVGGYGPSMIILVVQNLYGVFSPNEDHTIKQQRRERDRAWYAEEGRVPRPRWWDLSKHGNTAGLSAEERLTRFAREGNSNVSRANAVEVPDSMRKDSDRYHNAIPLQNLSSSSTVVPSPSPSASLQSPPPFQSPPPPYKATDRLTGELRPPPTRALGALNPALPTNDDHSESPARESTPQSIRQSSTQPRSMLDL